MRKVIGTGVLALLLIFGLTMSQAEATWYWFQVKDENGRPITSGFTCQVMTVASKAVDTLFADTGYVTQRTNPVVPDSNGVCAFATSATTVDVAIWGTGGKAKGATAKVGALTDVDHNIVLPTNTITKHLRFFWDRDISKGGETDTGIDLPLGAVVEDVFVEVATGVARMSVSVGLLSTEASGNAAGFCASQQTTLTAPPSILYRCEASRTTNTLMTLLTNDRFYYVSNTRGIFLASFAKGTGAAMAAGANVIDYIATIGQYQEYRHIVQPGAAKSIVYTTNDVGASAGWIHLLYKEFRTR